MSRFKAAPATVSVDIVIDRVIARANLKSVTVRGRREGGYSRA
jgi:hypothetical protein